MNSLCFGGSFNPIHNGHLACARAVARAQGFDQIRLIPSNCPPHKPESADLAAAEHRLAMCELVGQADPLFLADDIEMLRGGPSYTIETARQLLRQGVDQVNWLIGADMLLNLPTWRESLALLKEVNFLIVARPGFTFDWHRLPPAFAILQSHVIEAPLIDISATDIRHRVRSGQSIQDLVPQEVAAYIQQHHLYQRAAR